ncbi:hypothetical protein GCM10018793_25760 [Streptomyces sulfonofaciens]|uniref:Uncharacterized protein n=1 Tax=Streptomyces sulfonofaciens TaxID=68272 RepID=A0A919G414_9ACTN|nr:hypothetical protein GCM10018793_25760 [Streptomyces sulfonofaciens]
MRVPGFSGFYEFYGFYGPSASPRPGPDRPQEPAHAPACAPYCRNVAGLPPFAS